MVYYFTVQNGQPKYSPAKIVAFTPKFSSRATPVVYWSSAGNIHAHKMVNAEEKNNDISAPALGVAKYEVADPSIAEIDSYGQIKALKEGTTKITATAYGHSASVNFIVKSSESEADTTRDITVSTETTTTDPVTLSNPGSPSGGCNVGLSAMVILAGIALVMKKR